MTTGTVIAINSRTARFAVQAEDGQCTLYDMDDTNELQLGDRITGPLDELGSVTLYNVSQQESFAAFAQDVQASATTARTRGLAR